MAEERLREPKKNYRLTEEQREIKRHCERQRMLRMTDEHRAQLRERRRVAQQRRRRMMTAKQLKEQREASKRGSSQEEKDCKNSGGDAHGLTGSLEGHGKVDSLLSGYEHSKSSSTADSTYLHKSLDEGSTYLGANSGAKNNPPPLQGRIRLNWIRCQARLKNIEVVKRADAKRCMDGDQIEQEIHLNRDHGSMEQQEGALSRGVVEPLRSISSLKARNRLSYIRRQARTVNTLPSENVDLCM